MKVEKCKNSVGKPVDWNLSYKEAMSKEGVYRFVGFPTHHLIVLMCGVLKPCGLIYYIDNEESFLSGCTEESTHGHFRFLSTTKKICFELKD